MANSIDDLKKSIGEIRAKVSATTPKNHAAENQLNLIEQELGQLKDGGTEAERKAIAGRLKAIGV